MKFLPHKQFVLPMVFLVCSAIGLSVGLFVLQERVLPTLLPQTNSTEAMIGTNYDFKRLVVLVDEYNAFKEKTRARFGKQTFPSVNADYIDEMIKAAAHERICLQNYLWLLESRLTSEVSLKKKQKLLYYMKITNSMTKNLKQFKNKLS